MDLFKTRHILFSQTLASIHKEWRNKRNHIISTNNEGLLSYKGHLITFKKDQILFIPKGEVVRLAIFAEYVMPIVITVYKSKGSNAEASQHLTALMQTIQEVEGSALLSKEIVLHLLNDALEKSLRGFQIEEGINRPYKDKIISMLRADLKAKWTVEKVCQELFISKATMYRILKNSGVSFSNILTNERLDAAKRLLANTNASADKVAYECGFQSLSYFGKQFRSRFGVTPSQYRKSL